VVARAVPKVDNGRLNVCVACITEECFGRLTFVRRAIVSCFLIQLGGPI
jgi:hypothetical protein